MPSTETGDTETRAGLERLAPDGFICDVLNLKRVGEIPVAMTWRQLEILSLRSHHR